MSTVFQIMRPNGKVQIDDRYRLMTLLEKRTVSVTSGQTIGLSGTGQHVLVGFRTTLLYGLSWSGNRSGGNWSYGFHFQSGSGVITETVTFYIFGPKPAGDTSGLLVQTFDASGQLCADLVSARPIRVVANVASNLGWTGTSGRIYAPIMLGPYKDQAYINGVIWRFRAVYLRAAGNSIDTLIVPGATGSGRRLSTGTYLVADVTDY